MLSFTYANLRVILAAVFLALSSLFVKMTRSRIAPYWWLFLTLCGTVVLRFTGLTTESFSFDELDTMRAIAPEQTWGQVIQHASNDVHPPLYFLLAAGWAHFAGYTEWGVRSLSAITSTLGVLILYGFARQAGGKNAGMIAAILAAVNFCLINYAQDARSYALLFVVSCLAHWLFYRWMRSCRRTAMVAYFLSAIALTYLHYFGIFLLLGHALAFLALLPSMRKRRRLSMLTQGFAGATVLCLAYLPWAAVLSRVASKPRHWVPVPESDFYIEILNFHFGDQLIALFMVFLAGAYIVSNPGEEEDPSAAEELTSRSILVTLFLCALAGGLFAPYLHSLNATPILHAKYTIIVLPLLLLLPALALAQVRNVPVKIILVAFMILWSLTSLIAAHEFYRMPRNVQVREAVDWMAQSDLHRAFAKTAYLSNMEYYVKRLPTNELTTCYSYEEIVAELQAAPQNEELQFWYVDFGEIWDPSPELATLRDHFFVAEEVHAFYGISVTRFAARSPEIQERLAVYLSAQEETERAAILRQMAVELPHAAESAPTFVRHHLVEESEEERSGAANPAPP